MCDGKEAFTDEEIRRVMGEEVDNVRANNTHVLKKLEATEAKLAKLREEEILLHEACYAWGCLEYYASMATEEMEQELEERMKLLGYSFHSEEQIEAARAAIDSLKTKPWK